MDSKVRICLSHSPDTSLSVTTDGFAAVSTPTPDLHTLHVAARNMGAGEPACCAYNCRISIIFNHLMGNACHDHLLASIPWK
jgi:hypothetical protein